LKYGGAGVKEFNPAHSLISLLQAAPKVTADVSTTYLRMASPLHLHFPATTAKGYAQFSSVNLFRLTAKPVGVETLFGSWMNNSKISLPMLFIVFLSTAGAATIQFIRHPLFFCFTAA
jgi:hypothetical protein